MAHIWPIQPQIPNGALVRLASLVVVEAERLMNARVPRARNEVERLARTLAIWSVPVDRMAVTGPTYHLDLARRLEDHPEHGQQEPLAPSRAMADLYAFVAIGDRLLDDLARAVLCLEHRRPGAAAIPWNLLLEAFDEVGRDVSARDAVRRLHVGMRVARHRLVAHPVPDFASIMSWGLDDSLIVHLVAPQIPARARRMMLRLNGQLATPLPERDNIDDRALMESLVESATEMDSSQLRVLTDLTALAGLASVEVSEVVADVLRMTTRLIGRPAD